MVFITILAFVLAPILALPFVFVALKKDKKHRKIYFGVIAVFVALFSYSYTPAQTEDLYRHHLDVVQYEDSSFDELMKEISTKPEQLSIIYKFMISKTGNVNLLQFFAAAFCYYILLYLLDAYTEKNKKVKGVRLFGIWLFVLSGFHFLVITSGIFYTLALEIFSLAVYLDYECHKSKFSKVLYIIPVLIHTCAVLPLIVIILYKMLGSKNNIKNSIILAVLILSIGVLLGAVAASINLPLINEVSNLYKAYFGNEEYWSRLHTVPILALYLSRLIPIVFGCRVVKNRDSIGDFAAFMTVAILVLYFQTTFSIRYIHVAVLCGLPILFEASEDEKFGQLFCIMLYGLAMPHVVYQIKQLGSSSGFKNIHMILVTNLVTTLTGGC